MVGHRQHFVPRFLQAGFARRIDGEKVFTWVYRKGRPARECSTKDIGLETDFYSTPGDTAADDAITDAEGAFGALIESLRKSPPGAVSSAGIPGLIAHFEVRTRHLRQNLLQAGNEFMSRTVQSLAGHLERKVQSDQESMLKKPILEGLEKRGNPGNKPKCLQSNCYRGR